MQPFVPERHDRIGAELVHVDADLAKRLRRVDDRDRAAIARDAAGLRDREDVARLARHEREQQRPCAVAHAAAHFLEETVPVAVPSDLAELVAMLGAQPEGVERAAVLLGRREHERAGRDREPRDEGVQAVGGRLRERDVRRLVGNPERRRHVGPRGIEGRVVSGVSHVSEHADLVEPPAEPFGRALRHRERRPRAGHVEVKEVIAQRLERAWRRIRPFVDAGRLVGVGHAVMMPRIARPAVKRAANPSATD